MHGCDAGSVDVLNVFEIWNEVRDEDDYTRTLRAATYEFLVGDLSQYEARTTCSAGIVSRSTQGPRHNCVEGPWQSCRIACLPHC